MKKTNVFFLIALLMLFAFAAPASAMDEQKLIAAIDGTADDVFGYSVSVYGDTAVIGANDDDNSKGSAYVFIRSGGAWTQQARLTASAI